MDSFELSTDTYDTSSLRSRPASEPRIEEEKPIEEAPKAAPRQATPRAKAAPKAEARPSATTPKQHTARQAGVKFSDLFADGRLRIFTGILLILVAAYMLIVSISYMSHGAADQSVVLNRTPDAIAAAPDAVQNTGGWFGAFLSHMLVYRWLGIGAFIIIFYVGAVGVTLVGLHRFRVWRLTFRCLISAIAASIIIGLLCYNQASETYWGGEHGYYINQFLITNSGIWGAAGVSILLLSALILIFLDYISKVFRFIIRRIKAYKATLAERHAAALREAEEAERLAREEREEAERLKAEAGMQEHETAESTTEINVATATVEEQTEPTESQVTLRQECPALTDIDSPMAEADNRQPEVVVAPSLMDGEDADNITASENILDTTMEETASVTIDNTPTAPAVTTTGVSLMELPAATENALAEIPTAVDDDNENDNEEASSTTLEVERPEIEVAEVIDSSIYDPTAELSRYRLPSIELLKVRESAGANIDEEEQEENKERIIHTLQAYGIEISSIKATVGPTITLYEIVPAEGVRIAKIKRLGDDMTLSLSAIGIRIIAPMPGKGTIGMEVPNKNPQTVSIRSILSSKAYIESKAELPMAMGTTISNEVFGSDLAKMPHLLVAGATGMGKSVGLNTIIASLLYKKHPAELKFVLVDPKMVEFSLYKCLERHYLAKLPEEDDAIITDPTKVVTTLNSLCVEMDNRYALLSQAGMRGIKEYNQKFISRRLNPEKGHRYLPYIVVIIDEFADLILTAGKEVETPISRIAAKARAVGIHMILATQRPSVNVITGVIKANFPGRMAFRVTTMTDSRTILDRPGAEQLVGRGDMLMSRDGMIERVQCAFIDTDEVEAMCGSISDQIGYPTAYELPDYVAAGEGGQGNLGSVADRDPLFADAGRATIESGTGSTSYLQRKYNIGYPRAGKIMDQLEMAGVVGPSQGGKPRSVLMDMYSFERMLEG